MPRLHQVRLPASHPFAEGQENGRIFRRDGSHYKDETDLTLVATSAAGSSEAPAAAAAPASNDNTVYTVGGADFDNLEDAKAEALDLYDGENNVEIVATTRKVIGVVGFTSLAA